MQRVTRPSAVAVMPAPPLVPGLPGYFGKPDPITGVKTVPGYEWYNAVQEELIAIFVDAGLVPDAATLTQIRQAIRRMAGANVTTLSANTALTADHAGVVMIDAAGGNRTITLPAANAAGGRPLPFSLIRTDTSTNTVTVQCVGADTIEGGTSISLAVGERLSMVSDGASTWRFRSGRHTQLLAGPGWQRLPSGLIMQWGSAVTGGAGSVAVTFPIAFPAAVFSVVLGSNVYPGVGVHTLASLSTTGFSLFSWDFAGAAVPALNAYYLALGN